MQNYSESCSVVRLLAAPWTAAHQAPLSLGFSRQDHWSGWPVPPPGHLLDPRIEAGLLHCQEDSLLSEPAGKPPNYNTAVLSLVLRESPNAIVLILNSHCTLVGSEIKAKFFLCWCFLALIMDYLYF